MRTVDPPTEAEALAPGTIVGRYTVDEQVTRGGMGMLHRAHHTRTGQVVAIKVMGSEHDSQVVTAARFDREAELMERLASAPNVCHVYELSQLDDGRPYLVMEWVSGHNLDEIMDDVHHRQDSIDILRVCKILRDIAATLVLVHGERIIHRDIKPANIMVTHSDDGEEVAKLLDFGVSADLEEGGRRAGLTAAGYALGTIGYMAPEQAMGFQATEAFDIYALGAVGYELLTLDQAAASEIEAGVRPALEELRPDIPAVLAELIDRCLDQNPLARPRRASELERDLDDLIEVIESSQSETSAGADRSSRVSGSFTADDPSTLIGTRPFALSAAKDQPPGGPGSTLPLGSQSPVGMRPSARPRPPSLLNPAVIVPDHDESEAPVRGAKGSEDPDVSAPPETDEDISPPVTQVMGSESAPSPAALSAGRETPSISSEAPNEAAPASDAEIDAATSQNRAETTLALGSGPMVQEVATMIAQSDAKLEGPDRTKMMGSPAATPGGEPERTEKERPRDPTPKFGQNVTTDSSFENPEQPGNTVASNRPPQHPNYPAHPPGGQPAEPGAYPAPDPNLPPQMDGRGNTMFIPAGGGVQGGAAAGPPGHPPMPAVPHNPPPNPPPNQGGPRPPTMFGGVSAPFDPGAAPYPQQANPSPPTMFGATAGAPGHGMPPGSGLPPLPGPASAPNPGLPPLPGPASGPPGAAAGGLPSLPGPGSAPPGAAPTYMPPPVIGRPPGMPGAPPPGAPGVPPAGAGPMPGAPGANLGRPPGMPGVGPGSPMFPPRPDGAGPGMPGSGSTPYVPSRGRVPLTDESGTDAIIIAPKAEMPRPSESMLDEGGPIVIDQSKSSTPIILALCAAGVLIGALVIAFAMGVFSPDLEPVVTDLPPPRPKGPIYLPPPDDDPPIAAAPQAEVEDEPEIAPTKKRTRRRATPRKDEPKEPNVPAWQTDHCKGVRDDAEAAKIKRQWAVVIERTGVTECWGPAHGRRIRRVSAFSELKQYRNCVNAGRGATNPSIRKRVEFCAAKLKPQPE